MKRIFCLALLTALTACGGELEAPEAPAPTATSAAVSEPAPQAPSATAKIQQCPGGICSVYVDGVRLVYCC